MIDRLTDRIACLERLLVICAKQSYLDEGCIPDIAASAMSAERFAFLQADVTDDEVGRAAYGKDWDAIKKAPD